MLHLSLHFRKTCYISVHFRFENMLQLPLHCRKTCYMYICTLENMLNLPLHFRKYVDLPLHFWGVLPWPLCSRGVSTEAKQVCGYLWFMRVWLRVCCYRQSQHCLVLADIASGVHAYSGFCGFYVCCVRLERERWRWGGRDGEEDMEMKNWRGRYGEEDMKRRIWRDGDGGWGESGADSNGKGPVESLALVDCPVLGDVTRSRIPSTGR